MPQLLPSSPHSHFCQSLCIFYSFGIYYAALTPPDSPLLQGTGISSTVCLSKHLEANRILDSFTERCCNFTWYPLHSEFLYPCHGCLDSSLQEDTPSILPGVEILNQCPPRPWLPKRSVKCLSPKQFNPTLLQITAQHPSHHSNIPSLYSHIINQRQKQKKNTAAK